MAAIRRTGERGRSLPLRRGVRRGGLEILHPRPRAFGFVLEARDLVLLAQGPADIVEPVQQRMLASRCYAEPAQPAVAPADLLLFQIDAQRRIRAAFGIVEQFVEVLR